MTFFDPFPLPNNIVSASNRERPVGFRSSPTRSFTINSPHIELLLLNDCPAQPYGRGGDDNGPGKNDEILCGLIHTVQSAPDLVRVNTRLRRDWWGCCVSWRPPEVAFWWTPFF